MKTLLSILALLVLAVPVRAVTTQLAPNAYQITESVDFAIDNAGASDYLFTWTDSNGTFTDVVDPTLVLVLGQSYSFARVSTSHPFVITDTSMPVLGTDGSFFRDTFDGGVIDAATLEPIADFTADPAPTSDAINWTPGTIGDFYYTCRVISHPNMTGAIRVTANPVSGATSSFGAVKALFED